MSTYNDALPSEQQTVSCPFNKAHTVTRFVRHVNKCKKNNPHIDLRVCIFNIYHYFPPDEIEAHQKICSNRAEVERSIISVNKRKSEVDNNNSEPKRAKTLIPRKDSSDEWDDDTDRKSTVNVVSLEERRKRVEENPNMIVHVQHGTKSEREAKRRERRPKEYSLDD